MACAACGVCGVDAVHQRRLGLAGNRDSAPQVLFAEGLLLQGPKAHVASAEGFWIQTSPGACITRLHLNWLSGPDARRLCCHIQCSPRRWPSGCCATTPQCRCTPLHAVRCALLCRDGDAHRVGTGLALPTLSAAHTEVLSSHVIVLRSTL